LNLFVFICVNLPFHLWQKCIRFSNKKAPACTGASVSAAWSNFRSALHIQAALVGGLGVTVVITVGVFLGRGDGLLALDRLLKLCCGSG
jgi:hypothetical protein